MQKVQTLLPVFDSNESFPALASLQREESLLIQAFFEPYIPDELSVQLAGDTLLIKGEAVDYCSRQCSERNGNRISFKRKVPLPQYLVYGSIRAVLHDNALSIRLRIRGQSAIKTNEKTPNHIPVVWC